MLDCLRDVEESCEVCRVVIVLLEVRDKVGELVDSEEELDMDVVNVEEVSEVCRGMAVL